MLEVDPGVPEKFGTLTVAMASLSFKYLPQEGRGKFLPGLP